ncbi:MAG: T9SS type A sorting domain-containing protein [Bacteroidota bacterium]
MIKKFSIFAALLVCTGFGKSFAQCSFYNLRGNILSQETIGDSCRTVFNLFFDGVTNPGNKNIYIHLWEAPTYPVSSYTGAPTAADLEKTVLNLVIDNFGTPALQCTYGPAPTVVVQCAETNPAISYTRYPGAGTGGTDLFVISNITITTAGPCNGTIALKGDIWGSNANSTNANVQCNSAGSDVVIKELILPLKFIGFSAIAVNCGVNISFNTTNEINNQFFSVEQSHDNINWQSLSVITSKGNGDHSYGFTDTRPAQGINYYRLKQVDVDGQFSYSKTVSANNTCNRKNGVSVYPTIFQNNLYISMPALLQNGLVKIIDASGKTRISSRTNAAGTLLLTVGQLNPGIYIVQVFNNNERLAVEKIIKY